MFSIALTSHNDEVVISTSYHGLHRLAAQRRCEMTHWKSPHLSEWFDSVVIVNDDTNEIVYRLDW